MSRVGTLMGVTDGVIEQRWIVGKGEGCDVHVTDDYASSRHCEVARTTGGRYYVRDLGSTNGTWIRRGGLPVKAVGWTQIVPGDVLVVGRSEIPWDVAE